MDKTDSKCMEQSTEQKQLNAMKHAIANLLQATPEDQQIVVLEWRQSGRQLDVDLNACLVDILLMERNVVLSVLEHIAVVVADVVVGKEVDCLVHMQTVKDNCY